MITTGSTLEAVVGLAAVVLSIIGLANVVPHYMLTISAIALGAGLLFEGAFVAAEYRKLLAASAATAGGADVELGGGLSAQSLAGIATVVLGILALIGIATDVLVAIAAIVLGAGAIAGSASLARLNALRIETTVQPEATRHVAQGALTGTAGAQVVVGLAAIVLGILALIGLAPQTLDLVAMLALGASSLLTGSAFATRMLTAFAG